MARPSATSSRIEPRLMPVNTTPSRSPQARPDSILDSDTPSCGAHLGIGLDAGLEPLEQQRLGRAMRAAASAFAAARRCALSALEIRMLARSSSSAAFSGASVSAASALSINGSLVSSTPSRSSFTAALRCAGSGENSFNEAMRRVDLAAQSVAVDHVFGAFGQGRLGAGGGVVRLVVAHHEDLVAGGLHRIVEQGLEEFERLGVGAGRHLNDGGGALVALADRHRAHLLGRQRLGGEPSNGQQQREDAAMKQK